MLEFLLPWDFSPTVLAAVAIVAVLFVRGALRARPRMAQCFVFFLGLTLIYAALQTRWDYYAGHMFFVHRLQHLVLHDVGPLLLAWSAPAAVLTQGLPRTLRVRLQALGAYQCVQKIGRIVFDPWTATAMFIGSLCLWVWPTIHFYAMLSNWLYTLMNWSVVILDLPFWWLILDPRPYPQARLTHGRRILLLVLVMLPMILVGAVIGLSRRDLYPVYELCGRFFPVAPITDQQIGGLIIWIAGSMIAVIAALIALSRVLEQARTEEFLRRSRSPAAAA